MVRESVVIVGGGISGLSAAWELSGAKAGPNEATPRIEVIEASSRLGGSLATTQFAQRTVDLGADGFLARRPEVVDLVGELGWSDRLEAVDASGASIYLRGALDELPVGLALGIPTSSGQLRDVKGLSWRARLDAQRDELMPARMNIGDDATIGDIVRTKLGRELAYQFVEPMIGGIQAGRIDELSAKSVFPALLDAARKGGSLMKALRPSGAVGSGPSMSVAANGPMFYTLVSGVGSLPVEIARQLVERGVVIRTGVPVTALRRTPSASYPWEVDTVSTTTPADAVILATPAPTVGRFLGTLDSALDALSDVRSASAAMITFNVSRNDVTLPSSGTGVLVPLGTPWTEGTMMVTAVTFLDRKWPHLRRDDTVVLRAHVGRSDDSRWSELTDDELATRVTRELATVMAHFDNPCEFLVQRWPDGLPQYLVGHENLVTNAKSAAGAHRVALCGNAYDGVGIPASVGSGRRAAREVLGMLQLTSR